MRTKNILIKYIIVLFFFVQNFLMAQQSQFNIVNCNFSSVGNLVRGISVDDAEETEIYPKQSIQVNVTAYEHTTTRGSGFSVRCILLSYLYKACDYDYDGQEDFDLDNIATQIKQDYPNYKVTFYTSFFNAQVGTGLGLLTGNFTATTAQNPNIIFARLEDPSGKFIDGVKIKLMVYKVPQAENFNTIFYCTTIGSSIGAFNLKSIESGVENYTDFTFKYYTKETSANAGGTTDIIALPESYTGPAGKVYVRIENKEGCFIVREIPVAISSMTLASQTITVNPFCATEKLDLTSYISQLSNNDPDRYQFYFYTDQTSANANANTIANAIQDPENFDLTGLGDFSIWINISLNGGINCAKIVSKLNFSVIALPDIKIKTILPICEGNSINLEAETSVGNIVNWYDSETAIIPIFTGDSFMTPALTAYTIYWLESINSNNCKSPRISVEVKVNPLPVFNIPTGILICENTTTLLEVTTASTNVVNWFDSPTSTTPIFTGNQYQTSALPSNTSFWIEVTNPESCISERTEILVETKPETKPEFTIQTQFCENSTPINLPLISDDGISGTWDISTVDTSTVGKQIYTFTPDSGQCAAPFNIEVEVTAKLVPEFAIANQYCENSSFVTLPTTSDNGIIGTWNVSNIDTSTIGIKTYTFTPNDSCAETFDINIEIVSKLKPQFSFTNQFCQNSSLILLPTTSDNGIVGVWNVSNIDTSTIGIKTYTFTPNDSCAETINVNIEIISKLIPQFTFSTQYCQNSTSVSLPTTSNNGIIGTWNVSNIDTSTIGIKTYTFTPNDSCSDIITVNIEIVSKLKSQFSFATQYCQNSTSVLLPTTSDNGIIGTWNFSNIDTSTIGIKTYTFTPNDSCAEKISIQIEIISAPVITNVQINGTGIIVSANGNSLEYSLDGVIWQSSNVFVNVNVGSYEVYVKNNTGCISIYKTVSILKFNNFLSPNGDGSNDFWEIKGLPANSKFRIQILNKYGKTLIDKDAENDFKCDGKENGKPLQTDSYWYIITLESGQVFSGYILLKNF